MIILIIFSTRARALTHLMKTKNSAQFMHVLDCNFFVLWFNTSVALEFGKSCCSNFPSIIYSLRSIVATSFLCVRLYDSCLCEDILSLACIFSMQFILHACPAICPQNCPLARSSDDPTMLSQSLLQTNLKQKYKFS